MKIPKGLKLGDKIGLVAPSSPSSREEVDRARKAVENMGFQVELGASAYKSYGYLAGEDQNRADDINNMFANKEIDGIICLRGGYGASRILDLLDYDTIRENPKVFVGYSDITVIHTAINQKADLVSYHGPMAISNLSKSPSDFTLDGFKNIVMDGDYTSIIENPSGEKVTTIKGGLAQGQLIGGNLSLIVNTIGTDYEIDTNGKILLIEEVGEDPYAIDRMLTQLRLAGKLDGIEGIVLGDFTDCVASKKEYDQQLPLEKVFVDRLGDLDVPCVYNLKIGHCEPVITVPFGIEIKLNADKGYIELLEKPNL